MRKPSFPDLSMIYFDALLGSPWDHLGAIFVQSLEHLGTTLGYLWKILRSSWAIFDNLGSPWNHIGSSWCHLTLNPKQSLSLEMAAGG